MVSLRKWFPDGFSVERYSRPDPHISDTPRASFMDEMRAHGFVVPPTPKIAVIDRITAPGDKPHKKSGWYIYQEVPDDSRPGCMIGIGVFGNWKGDPEKVVWVSKRQQSMTVVERAEFDARLEAARIARENEVKARHIEAAGRANELWQGYPAAQSSHDYLRRKTVRPHGARYSQGDLVIPVYFDGHIVSLQYIRPDGSKKFLSGGQTKDSYYPFPGAGSTDAGIERVYVAEGWATGASIAEATGCTCYAAFNAGNLMGVASMARAAHRDADIWVAGDDDQWTDGNPGRTKATLAAQATRSKVIFPTFADMSGKPTDFNDMALAIGVEGLRDYLAAKPEAYSAADAAVRANLPDELAFPPGILGDIASYYHATSGNEQPGFAVQTALAVGSLLAGRNYCTNKGNFASLFFLNVGKSGTGKEHSKTVMEEILAAAGLENLIAGDGYTSAGAIFSTLLQKPRHLTVIDEFGRYLEASKAQKNSNLHEANTQLMQAITRCHSIMRPPSYSTMTLSKDKIGELQNRKVYNPSITLLSMTTPDTLFQNLDAGSVKDGFVNRFVISVSEAKRTVRTHKDPMEVPHRIKDWAQKIGERAGEKSSIAEITGERPSFITIAFSPEALAEQEAFQHYCIGVADRMEAFGLAEVSGRTVEMAMRIALIVSLARNPRAERIDADDMKWAITYMRMSLDTTVEILKSKISRSAHESDKKEILKAIRDCGEAGITFSRMVKTSPFSHHKAKDLKEILTALVDAELIDEEGHKSGTRGRPTVRYWALA